MTAEIIPFKIEQQTDGELRVSDEEISSHLGYKDVKDFRALVREHRKNLEKISNLVIERFSKREKGEGGRRTERFWLTEAQSLFMISRSGTEVATDIMVAVSIAFVEMRREHRHTPLTKDLLRLNILSPEVQVWEKRFEKPFFDNLHRVMHLKKPGRNNHPNCGHFINRYVYEFLFGNLGLEVIREANPNALRTNSVGENEYRRAYRHHQMLKGEHIPAFKQHIRTLNTLLGVSTSIGHFDDIFNATFPKHHTQIGFMFNELQKRTPATQEARS